MISRFLPFLLKQKMLTVVRVLRPASLLKSAGVRHSSHSLLGYYEKPPRCSRPLSGLNAAGYPNEG